MGELHRLDPETGSMGKLERGKAIASNSLSKDTLYCNYRKNGLLNFVASMAAVPLLFGCFNTSALGGCLSVFKMKMHFFPKGIFKDIKQRVRPC